MTNIIEVLVQIKSNKREGKKHLAQGCAYSTVDRVVRWLVSVEIILR